MSSAANPLFCKFLPRLVGPAATVVASRVPHSAARSLAAVLGLMLTVLQPAFAREEAGIRRFTPESLREIEQAHRGEPFVMVLWSLDCVYCKASVRYLAGQENRGKLKIVTVATDSIDDALSRAAIRGRLVQAKLRGEAWAYGDAPAEQIRYAIDPAWYGELPRSYWYDARGNRTAYSGVIDAAVLARHMTP